jgi:hypothetical protein
MAPEVNRLCQPVFMPIHQEACPMADIEWPRRDLLLAPMLAALLPPAAKASPLNPAETVITLPPDIPWQVRPTYPKDSVISAPLYGSRTGHGIYVELIKWYPGYMSAPHYYATDRLCVVISGTWWVNSGADFDPAQCVPVPAGSFVHRVARTPHYDGVVASGREPAIIAICGMAPVDMKYLAPTTPPWRKVT